VTTDEQGRRLIAIDTPLGPDQLMLLRLTGSESISAPFSFELQLASQNAIRFEDIVGKPVTVSVALIQGERFINGVVSRFRQTGEEWNFRNYSAQIVPWFWLLTRRADCRIFQNKSTPEIIEQVFKNLGFSDYEFSLIKSYPKRDYCVQYRETDFNFVSRLIEYHGIYYFFRHEAKKHVMVFVDSPSMIKPCPSQAKAEYKGVANTYEDRDVVTSWQSEQEIRPGSWALTDFNFEKPLTTITASTDSLVKTWEKQLQIYDYPAGCDSRGDAEALTKVRMEAEESFQMVAHADTTCRAFATGFKFELVDPPEESQAGEWLITEIHHEATANAFYSGQVDQRSEYRNRIVGIPAAVPFHPPRVAREPRVPGPQTALVVGPKGEEIYPDKYGRVKVQFHWDRAGKYDADSSCWIRVSQAWAGKGWGSLTLPRIGQEVIVSFLEGDPDQPIITGRVYNGEDTPPYPLPDEKTKTVLLKSNSTKGGGGFNELRIEDKKGEEQIFFHAEKNLDIRVKNNEYETVTKDLHLIVEQDKFEQTKNDHNETIERDYAQAIGRDHHLKVTGKEAAEVGGSRSLKVTGDVAEQFGSNFSTQVSMAAYLKAGQTIVLEAPTGITLKCGGNSIVLDPSGVTITASGLVTIQGSMVMINSGPGSPPTPGQACTLVPPMKPKDVDEADKADPGEMDQIKQQQIAQGTGKYGLVSLAPHKPPASGQAGTEGKTHWIEIELLDSDGNPVPGEEYRITLPDGSTVASGTLDGKGKARVEAIDAGSCQVTFPKLDKTSWGPHGQ
jgi:type VI secretion system secreted protein VgrG